MNTYIAFLRGINVGGNTKIAMKDLVAWCTDIGFQDAKTYINSGNVLFKSSLQEMKLQTQLESKLLEKMNKAVSVVIRNIKNIQQLVIDNPFPKAEPAKVGVLLLADSLPKKILEEFKNITIEKISLGKSEIFIHYPDGMGRSKLTWPASLKNGTVRNINTLTKLAEMAKKGENI